jgi:hypothetical protein
MIGIQCNCLDNSGHIKVTRTQGYAVPDAVGPGVCVVMRGKLLHLRGEYRNKFYARDFQQIEKGGWGAFTVTDLSIVLIGGQIVEIACCSWPHVQ